MPTPFDELERDELKQVAMDLLKLALARLEADNVQGATVRLANALGALSHVEPTAKGILSYTALGYRLATMPVEISNARDSQ